eukprot:COSAG02_NODE_2763_length_8071_cov_26.991846_8_plen_68_part_00
MQLFGALGSFVLNVALVTAASACYPSAATARVSISTNHLLSAGNINRIRTTDTRLSEMHGSRSTHRG